MHTVSFYTIRLISSCSLLACSPFNGCFASRPNTIRENKVKESMIFSSAIKKKNRGIRLKWVRASLEWNFDRGYYLAAFLTWMTTLSSTWSAETSTCVIRFRRNGKFGAFSFSSFFTFFFYVSNTSDRTLSYSIDLSQLEGIIDQKRIASFWAISTRRERKTFDGIRKVANRFYSIAFDWRE